MPGGAEGVREQLTEVGGGVIRSWSGGDGPVVVVLHHSFGNPGWLPFHRELSERCTVVAPDLPGFGGSAQPRLGAPPSGPGPLDGLVAAGAGVRTGDPGRMRLRGMGGGGAEHHEPGAAGRPGPGGAGGAPAQGRADPRPGSGVALRVRARRLRGPESLRSGLRRRSHRRPSAVVGHEPRDDHTGGLEAVHVQPPSAPTADARARAGTGGGGTVRPDHAAILCGAVRRTHAAGPPRIVPNCGHAVDMEQPSVLAGLVAGHLPGAP